MQCTACAACVDACERSAISLVDSYNHVTAIIDEKKCISCNRCVRICPTINKVEKKSIEVWKQGWSKNIEIRSESSSGGIAAEISRYYVNSGGYVASCYYDGVQFSYKITNSIQELSDFSGSKYVKSNPVNIYKKVKKLILDGEKVVFIGLPCHVAAMKRYVGEAENLLLVDLICHGTPSMNTFKEYISQNRISNKKIEFRKNGHFGMNTDKNVGITDPYMISFLYCLNYTENCYSCQYTGTNRVSDITLGDSWGSELPKDKNGISLVLCSSDKGVEMLSKIEAELFDVNIDLAIENNAQLREPSRKPSGYDKFIKRVTNHKNYALSVAFRYPIQTLKQLIKYCLIKLNAYPRMYESEYKDTRKSAVRNK